MESGAVDLGFSKWFDELSKPGWFYFLDYLLMWKWFSAAYVCFYSVDKTWNMMIFWHGTSDSNVDICGFHFGWIRYAWIYSMIKCVFKVLHLNRP